MASEPVTALQKAKSPFHFLVTKWVSCVKDFCDEHDDLVLDDDEKETSPCKYAMVSFLDGQSRTTGDIGIVQMRGLKLRNCVTGTPVNVTPKEVIFFLQIDVFIPEFEILKTVQTGKERITEIHGYILRESFCLFRNFSSCSHFPNDLMYGFRGNCLTEI